MKEDVIFTQLVDEMILYADSDPELKQGLQFLDHLAQEKGVSIYDVVFDRLYRYDMKEKAKRWLHSKN